MLNLLFYLLLQLGLVGGPSTPLKAPASLQKTTITAPTQSLDAALLLDTAPLDITIGTGGSGIGSGGWDDKN